VHLGYRGDASPRRQDDAPELEDRPPEPEPALTTGRRKGRRKVTVWAALTAVVVAVAAVAVVDANTGEEPPPPERAQLRESRADVRRLVAAQGEARERQEELREVGTRLRRRLTSTERRAARLEDDLRKLRRNEPRRRGRARR